MSNASPTSSLFKQLTHTIGNKKQLTVAYSGGLDSTVLLHLCQSLCEQNSDINLQAIHINHGLSAHAQQWQEHCQAVCDAWHIPLLTDSVNLKRKPRTSLEQQAREARYQAIEKHVEQERLILLAQHQDDQAETYLLQLARGAGSEGLSAMPGYWQSNSKHSYARPLLAASRSDLLDYASACKLTWVEDESNQDEGFYRNFIRHKVMPVLQSKWPSIARTISRSASHHAHSVQVINEYMEVLSPSVIDADARLIIDTWQDLSKATRISMLRHWLKPLVKIIPSTEVLDQISKMAHAREDAQGLCRWGSHAVRRYAGKLYVLDMSDENEEITPNDFSIMLSPGGDYTSPFLPYKIKRVSKQDADKFDHFFALNNSQLNVVFGRFSAKCRLHPKRPTKTVKKWLQDMNIPPWERQKIPMLMHQNQLLALGEHIACEPVQVQNDSSEPAPEAIYIALIPTKQS